MLLYVARPPKLVESRLVGRDWLQEVCIPVTGRPVIGVVVLSPSVRPVVRPVARPVALLVVVVRPLPVSPVSSCAVVAVGLLCLFCPSVCPCGFSIMEQRNKLVATSSSLLYPGLCVASQSMHEPTEHVSSATAAVSF